MAAHNLPPLPLPPEKWQEIAQALKLSKRHKKIVELILRNRCDKQIAATLGISESTVRTHLDRIFRRLGVDGRQGIVLIVFRMSHGIGCPQQ